MVKRWPSRRLALGLSPTPTAGLMLLVAGIALGPHGLNLLSEATLSSLDPAVSASLAALGALVGLEIRVRRPREGRLLAAANLEGGVTILVVAFGIAIVHYLSPAAGSMPWLLALMLGICAAPSSTPAVPIGSPRGAVAARIGDLDDVLPIVLGVVVVAWTRPGPPLALASLVAQGAGIALTVAVAGWLLIAQTSSESEQRVFAVGTLLLVGGAAAHLSTSALFAGLVAGIFWNATSTPARDAIARDLRYLQHPLVVLLLVVAGGRLELTSGLWGLVIAFVVLRLAGKLAGGWIAGRAAPELPGDLGFRLSAPGVAAVAIALDASQAQGGPEAATMFAIVIAGSLGSELISVMGSRQHEIV